MLALKEESAPRQDALAKHDLDLPSDQRVADVYPQGVDPARRHLLSLVQASPNWQTVGPTHQPRVETLVLGEIDAAESVVTARSKRELAEKYNWTPGEVLRTLAALRSNGIAYSLPRWDIAPDGRAHQIASEYRLVTDGLHFPQAKRGLTPAQERGAKRAAKTRRKRRLEAA